MSEDFKLALRIGGNEVIVKPNPENDPKHPHLLIVNHEMYRANFYVPDKRAILDAFKSDTGTP